MTSRNDDGRWQWIFTTLLGIIILFSGATMKNIANIDKRLTRMESSFVLYVKQTDKNVEDIRELQDRLLKVEAILNKQEDEYTEDEYLTINNKKHGRDNN